MLCVLLNIFRIHKITIFEVHKKTAYLENKCCSKTLLNKIKMFTLSETISVIFPRFVEKGFHS